MRNPALVLIAVVGIISGVHGQGVNQVGSVQIFMGNPGAGPPVVQGTADSPPNPGGRLHNVRLSVTGTTLQITADGAELDGPYLVLFGDVRLTVNQPEAVAMR
jgi:hypothetical protein